MVPQVPAVDSARSRQPTCRDGGSREPERSITQASRGRFTRWAIAARFAWRRSPPATRKRRSPPFAPPSRCERRRNSSVEDFLDPRRHGLARRPVAASSKRSALSADSRLISQVWTPSRALRGRSRPPDRRRPKCRWRRTDRTAATRPRSRRDSPAFPRTTRRAAASRPTRLQRGRPSATGEIAQPSANLAAVPAAGLE